MIDKLENTKDYNKELIEEAINYIEELQDEIEHLKDVIVDLKNDMESNYKPLDIRETELGE